MCDATKSFPYIDDPIVAGNILYEIKREDTNRIFETVPGITPVVTPEHTPNEGVINNSKSERETRIRSGDGLDFLSQPCDNTFSEKLYGNKYNLEREKKMLQQKRSLIIHPCSRFRTVWLMVMVTLLDINLIIVTVSVAFFSNDFTSTLVIVNLLFDSIFFLDVIVNCRTGIIMNQAVPEVSLHSGKILRHYLTSWFAIDLASSIPFDYIFILFSNSNSTFQLLNAGRALRLMRIMKIISLLRLLRVFRLVRYILDVQRLLSLSSKAIPIVNIFLLSVLMNHICACLQFFVPRILDFPMDCWVRQKKILDSPTRDQYFLSLTKATSDMFQSSLGTYSLTLVSDQLARAATMIIGSILCLLFAAYFIRAIVTKDIISTLSQLKLTEIETYMVQKHLPNPLKKKVMDYIHYRYGESIIEECGVLGRLSDNLKQEILLIRCKELLHSSYLFGILWDPNFIADIALKFTEEVYLPGDDIVREGTIGSKMFFVQDGSVDIVRRDGYILLTLSGGSNFGELSLLTSSIRLVSARAQTHCSVFSISREDFLSVLQRHPKVQCILADEIKNILTNLFNNPLWRECKRLVKMNALENKEILMESAENVEEKTGIELKLKRILSDATLQYYNMEMTTNESSL